MDAHGLTGGLIASAKIVLALVGTAAVAIGVVAAWCVGKAKRRRK